MDHYLDIHVLPDPEFDINVIMNALYSKLHRGFASVGHGELGVSFPGMDKKGLGSQLRLHGTHESLSRLMAIQWVVGLRDHIQISNILLVPEVVQHRVVSRMQVKSSAERLRRRSVKNGKLTEAEAQERILETNEKRCKLPFIQLKSSSTGQIFHLYIQHSAPQFNSVAGKFSDYGLSSVATVPYF